jgi:hypothetical protein
VIPNEYHFVWFGPSFPFTHALAVRSLAATSRPDAIHLHLSDDLAGQPHFDALVKDIGCLRIHPIDFDSLVAQLDGVDRPGLRTAYRALAADRRFAALSDILRFSLLYRSGGCYLDLDTITVRDLRPLLSQPGFCGQELILVPAGAARRIRVLGKLRTGPLHLLRLLCAKVPQGVVWFKRIAPLFSPAVNGAVLGLAAGHPLAHEALKRIPALWPQVARRRPAIGPDLLQDLIADPRFSAGVTVFGPRYFYPLGPYMAAHFFRDHPDVGALERAALCEETHVVHWYNDNLEGMERPPDPASIRDSADRQLFSRMALPFLPARPDTL